MGRLDHILTVTSGLGVIALLFVFYLLPTVIAIKRKHKNVAPIVVINVFLGWTFLGWVAALAWCMTSDVKEGGAGK